MTLRFNPQPQYLLSEYTAHMPCQLALTVSILKTLHGIIQYSLCKACHNKSSAVAEMGDCFCHNRHGPKRHGPKSGGGCCAPFHGGSWSSSNTMSPGPRRISVPSGILIHPTVWPQYSNVIDKQDRTLVP